MTRRFTLLASAGLLTIPGIALAFYPPQYCPPPRYVYCPPVPLVCPTIPVDCPPAMTGPAKPLAPPKVMEKSEVPEPKPVKPAAASEPIPMKVDVPRPEIQKGELAIPSPAVPETPIEKPKPKPLEAAPFTLPPIEEPKKKEEPATKLELPSPRADALPKLEIPPLTLPPTTIVPVKAEEKKIPAITLPNISESKYTPSDLKVRVIPVEGKRASGNQTVNFYNYTSRDLQLSVDGKATKIPAKSLLAVALPDSFAWKFAEQSETVTIPTDSAGLSIIIQ